MEFITWKDNYSVKVPSIDNQHQKLVSLINELYSKFYQDLNNEDLKRIFDELESYAGYHFNYEEKFMKLYGFKGYNEHQQEHESFRNKIVNYRDQLDSSKTSEVIDLLTYLKDWLLKHIMGTDRKYANLFVEKGLK